MTMLAHGRAGKSLLGALLRRTATARASAYARTRREQPLTCQIRIVGNMVHVVDAETGKALAFRASYVEATAEARRLERISRGDN